MISLRHSAEAEHRLILEEALRCDRNEFRKRAGRLRAATAGRTRANDRRRRLGRPDVGAGRAGDRRCRRAAGKDLATPSRWLRDAGNAPWRRAVRGELTVPKLPSSSPNSPSTVCGRATGAGPPGGDALGAPVQSAGLRLALGGAEWRTIMEGMSSASGACRR